MKDITQYERDLASIRSMMERSAKFISLSGLSGILAGLYALCGATAAYFIVQYPLSPFRPRINSINEAGAVVNLILIATAVLFASLSTGILLSNQKAKKHDLKFWTPVSQRLMVNMGIPLFTGGVFILIMIYHGHFELTAPASLIFYGLALIQGSSNTFDEIRYLGFCEIILGLIATFLLGYGLIFWALGFGILHIVYGVIMYNKYDK